jgi:polyhydroxybutyrate depolymerase
LIDCPVLPPVTVAAIHGSADTYFPLTGGIGAHAPPGLPPARPPEQTLTLFRGIDECPDQPTSSTGPPAAQRSWSCLAGHSVSVAVVNGAGHQWPGATPPPGPGVLTLGPGTDPPSTALNATDWLWTHLRDSRSR